MLNQNEKNELMEMEQLPIGLAADIYGIGLICYELLTGKQFRIAKSTNIDPIEEVRTSLNKPCSEFLGQLLVSLFRLKTDRCQGCGFAFFTSF